MAYYRVTAPDNGENILMDRAPEFQEIITTRGRVIDEEFTLPIKIDMDVGEESGYDRYMPGFTGEVEDVPLEDRLLDYYRLPPLMSKRLVEALTNAGVDNLQTFPVEIKDVETGEVLNKEYLLVNVLGLVSCAEMDESEYDPVGEMQHFYKLKIDEKKANGQLLFRLKESPYEIIVEEKIADILDRGEFKGIEPKLAS